MRHKWDRPAVWIIEEWCVISWVMWQHAQFLYLHQNIHVYNAVISALFFPKKITKCDMESIKMSHMIQYQGLLS